ncbi:hypothetical protein N7494_013159 [Penicillium frequentans]|uniref:Uncharacterized protein n=1 Tax=Penicillium frequentans TaxID=3151616 RepID=A0AAD6G8Y1_9EURO|nr:hypothetical protein N7494_013159 [Penicillium glabrum]
MDATLEPFHYNSTHLPVGSDSPVDRLSRSEATCLSSLGEDGRAAGRDLRRIHEGPPMEPGRGTLRDPAAGRAAHPRAPGPSGVAMPREGLCLHRLLDEDNARPPRRHP